MRRTGQKENSDIGGDSVNIVQQKGKDGAPPTSSPRNPPRRTSRGLASGLRAKKQREHAAIRDAGMTKLYKHVAITLKYNMDLRGGIFGASSTGSDGDGEASSEEVSFDPEIQMNPASLRARS
ncbi:hypothetical protein FBULB1_14233 [Fusarium bulbicola]|nr:hypothetical protein FBULB1_14233 [Fusarium bulbicola]